MKLTKLNQLLEDGQVIKGRWIITPNHEVQYRFEGKDEEIKVTGSLIAAEPDALVISVTEKQKDQKIVTSIVKLSGVWKLNTEKNRLTYSIGGDSNNAFKFRGAFQTTSIYAKKGEIRYQIGVEVAGKRKSISFGGTYSLEESSVEAGAKFAG